MHPSLENIHPNPGESIVAFEYELPSFESPWHFHPQVELTYIRKSSGIRYMGNNISTFEEGDLVLVGQALPHCWKNSKGYKEGAQALVIQWEQGLLAKGFEFEKINLLEAAANRGIRFNPNISKKVLPQIENVVRTNGVLRYINFISLLDSLSYVKDYEFLSDNHSFSFPSQEVASRIQVAYEFVMSNFASRITLYEVAQRVHMTEESFSRFFSKTMQKSFFAYLNEYRINVSCKMLLESDLSVQQIAFDSGYESLPFFYQQFRKYKSISPRIFRIKFRNVV